MPEKFASVVYGWSLTKVIIEKFRGEVSLVGQDTIENVSKPIKNLKRFLKIQYIHQNVPQIIETFLRYMMVS